MTEREWLECGAPERMLDFLRGRTSDRKYRLFACACVRRHADLLNGYAWSGPALEAAERFSDGRLSQSEMNRAASDFDAAVEEEDLAGAADRVSTALWHLMNACKAIEGAAWAKSKAAADCLATAAAMRKRDAGSGQWKKDRDEEGAEQARLLRCIAQPFHGVEAAAYSADAARLAQATYEERILPSGHLDPARLAVFSDAMEEAGCDDAELLDHLRSPGPHARGCWAVDTILRKT